MSFLDKIMKNKRKGSTLILVVFLVISSIIVYQNYNIKSTTINSNTISSDANNHNEIGEDVDPPDTLLVSRPDDVVNSSNVTFTWSGIDDVSSADNLIYSYKLEGKNSTWSPWVNQASKTYINLPNGQYIFFVRAKDEAGNIDPVPIETTFTIDIAEGAIPPETNILTGPTGTINFNTTTFTWNATDDNTSTEYLEYSIILEGLDSSWSSWTTDTSKTYTDVPNGGYTFKVKAKDEAGNIDPTPAEQTFTINTEQEDTIPPDTVIQSSPSGTIDYNDVTFTWNGNDDVTPNDGLCYSYKLVGLDSSWVSWTSSTSKDYYNLPDGEYTFKVKAKDEAGNIDPTPAEQTFTINTEQEDTTPPETNILTGPTGIIDYTDVTFTWTGSDDTTTVDNLKYSIMLEGLDSSWSSWTTDTSKIYVDLSDREYTFKVKAKDEAGNIDPTPAEQTFTINTEQEDTIPPETNILTGPTGTINFNTITFTWNATDNVTPAENIQYSYKLEEESEWSSWTSDTSKIYVDLSDGEYTFKVKAKDEAGNIDPTPAEQSFIIGISGTEPDRFATNVIDFSGGGNTDIILGGPRGRGEYQGSTHVLSLGTSGIVTLGFNVSIANGPGKDFIVFENPFSILDQYGEPTGMVFAELVYIEVSTDGINFARFPSTSITADPVGPYQGIYPENVTNLAGVYPVFANVDQNGIDPFDPDEAGGDAFDLDVLCDHPLVREGIVNLHDINYLRILDILGDGSCLDSQDNPIYDPTGPGNNGADIDAVSVINYSI